MIHNKKMSPPEPQPLNAISLVNPPCPGYPVCLAECVLLFPQYIIC